MTFTTSEGRNSHLKSGWTSSLILARSLRIGQLLISIITMGLLAYVEHELEMDKQSLLHLALATSVVSIVYVSAIFIGTSAWAAKFVVVPILMGEVALLCLWIASFASLIYLFHKCHRWPEEMAGIYWVGQYIRRCEASNAAIAMAAIEMVLYDISFFLILYNAVGPISSSFGSKFLWRPVGSANVAFDKGTGLVLLDKVVHKSDSEHGLAATSQSVCSTSTQEGTEKANELSGIAQPQILLV